MGLRASILLAVADAVRKRKNEKLGFCARGAETCVAALAAIALSPQDDFLFARGLPETLKEPITRQRYYYSQPTLFCFGLLETADIPQLRRLAGQANVLPDFRALMPSR